MADGKFAVVKTDAEWKSLLAPDAYRVLRKSSTEPAGAACPDPLPRLPLLLHTPKRTLRIPVGEID